MNEIDARQWITDIVSVFQRGAALTSNVFDDKALMMARMAVDNDIIWGWMWTVLRPILEDGDVERVMAVASCPPEVEAESDKVEIDPLVILAIIKAIMDLISIWRKRRA